MKGNGEDPNAYAGAMPASKLTTSDVRPITLCLLYLLDAFCFPESKEAVLVCGRNISSKMYCVEVLTMMKPVVVYGTRS